MDEIIAWGTLPLHKYADFNGRARRKEYWLFALLFGVASIVLSILNHGILAYLITPVHVLFALALIVPSLAVAVRRLHDTNRSGWWVLIGLVPFVGGIILLVFLILEGTPGANQYGADPLEGERGFRIGGL